MELGAFIAQGSAGSVVDQALACLLGLLGLRISEALHIDIEHLGIQRGPHRHRAGQGLQAGGDPAAARVARPSTWPPARGLAVRCCWDATVVG